MHLKSVANSIAIDGRAEPECVKLGQPCLRWKKTRSFSLLARSTTVSSIRPLNGRHGCYRAGRAGATSLSFATGLRRALGLLPGWLGARPAGAFGILMYHRIVVPPRDVSAPTWNVTPARFRCQLAGLLRRGYRPWPLRKALASHLAGEAIPAKTFVVTFDDGYENVYRHALPILRDLQVPATIFLATAYLDSPAPFPFDAWQGAGSPGVPADTWKPLTSAQCADLLASGLIELGGHTHTHDDFRNRPGDLRRDLALSLETLQTRFGLAEATLAFPYGYGCRGNDGPELAEAAQDAGTLCALTTDENLVRPRDDCFNWGRFSASNFDSAASLAAKLNGTYSRMRCAWKRLRRRSPPDQTNRLEPQMVASWTDV